MRQKAHGRKGLLSHRSTFFRDRPISQPPQHISRTGGGRGRLIYALFYASTRSLRHWCAAGCTDTRVRFFTRICHDALLVRWRRGGGVYGQGLNANLCCPTSPPPPCDGGGCRLAQERCGRINRTFSVVFCPVFAEGLSFSHNYRSITGGILEPVSCCSVKRLGGRKNREQRV